MRKYMLAVEETTGDSEGFRGLKRNLPPFGRLKSSSSSGRCLLLPNPVAAPTPTPTGEYSRNPKRKSISLNANEDFNAPAQLYDLSLMSTTERMLLCKRLKIELEQVRFLYQQIESKTVTVNAATVVSSSSEMPSLSSGQRFENDHMNPHPPVSIQIPAAGSRKTPKANQSKPKSEDVGTKMSVGMKRLPSGTGRRLETESSQVVKRRKDDSRRRADPIIKNQCGTILRRLMLHKYGYVFDKPVDIVALNIPDYFNVIKKPMDLGTIKQKLETNCYLDPRDFAADVRLTFANAIKYNPPGNDVHFMAGMLSEVFESKWRSITRKLPEVVEPGPSPSSPATKASTKQYQQKQRQLFPKSKLNKTEPIAVEHIPIVKRDACKRPLTREEKQKLSRDLESLCDMPKQIMDLLRKNSSHLSQNADEIEVDVDALNDDTLLRLQKLVTDCLQNNAAKNHLPREAEPVIILRPGNSNCNPVNNIKGSGGDTGDEVDIDIEENDLPVSSHPPVDIEKDKDTFRRSSEGTSSSCSSSDSGSSSSDSGFKSSSCNESDGAPKADATSLKEPRDCDAGCNETSIPSMDTHGAKRAVSGLDEENAHSKPPPADGHHEGESAPTSSERQMYPDKLYRAALLRSRFADTILKAQEKTLSQGDSGDPEKLRREKEELERRQREEKARLQAEAKAAEIARMRAEAMAAAEAKRKLESEREAARLALQQMEKTVEIDENTQVLKDLEMFRTSQADHIPSSGAEISPQNSHDRLEPFPLHGRNPLEQLGLFMKRDEEEEEDMVLFMKRDEQEVVASSVPGNGDFEEGEID